MGRLAPTAQPSSVTTAGTIVTVPIGVARVGRILERLVAAYMSGDATSFTAEWSTHSLVTDPTKTILKMTSGSRTEPLDALAPTERGFAWDDSKHDGNLYCKIMPNTGVNNAFNVAAYLQE